MTRPLVSVRIPTYNRQEMLKESWRSVIGQRKAWIDFDIELVVLNNGCTDETDRVIGELMAETPSRIPVKLLYEKENSTNNIPKMDAHLSGDYIVQFTDDDIMDECFLETALLNHDRYHTEAPIFSCIVKTFTNVDSLLDGNIKGGMFGCDEITFDQDLATSRLVMPATVIKRDAYFTPVQHGCDPGGEWSLHLEILNKFGPAVVYDVPMVYLRCHEGSDTNTRGISQGKFLDMHFSCWEHWIKHRGYNPTEEAKNEMMAIYTSMLLAKWGYPVQEFKDEVNKLLDLLWGSRG